MQVTREMLLEDRIARSRTVHVDDREYVFRLPSLKDQTRLRIQRAEFLEKYKDFWRGTGAPEERDIGLSVRVDEESKQIMVDAIACTLCLEGEDGPCGTDIAETLLDSAHRDVFVDAAYVLLGFRKAEAAGEDGEGQESLPF